LLTGSPFIFFIIITKVSLPEMSRTICFPSGAQIANYPDQDICHTCCNCHWLKFHLINFNGFQTNYERNLGNPSFFI
jgi:hypothetical protein